MRSLEDWSARHRLGEQIVSNPRAHASFKARAWGIIAVCGDNVESRSAAARRALESGYPRPNDLYGAIAYLHLTHTRRSDEALRLAREAVRWADLRVERTRTGTLEADRPPGCPLAEARFRIRLESRRFVIYALADAGRFDQAEQVVDEMRELEGQDDRAGSVWRLARLPIFYMRGQLEDAESTVREHDGRAVDLMRAILEELRQLFARTGRTGPFEAVRRHVAAHLR